MHYQLSHEFISLCFAFRVKPLLNWSALSTALHCSVCARRESTRSLPPEDSSITWSIAPIMSTKSESEYSGDFQAWPFSHGILCRISSDGVDIILDCLCGDDCNRGYGLLKPMGKYILFGSSNVVTGETKSFFSVARSVRFNLEVFFVHSINSTLFSGGKSTKCRQSSSSMRTRHSPASTCDTCSTSKTDRNTWRTSSTTSSKCIRTERLSQSSILHGHWKT